MAFLFKRLQDLDIKVVAYKPLMRMSKEVHPKWELYKKSNYKEICAMHSNILPIEATGNHFSIPQILGMGFIYVSSKSQRWFEHDFYRIRFMESLETL